MVYFSSFIGIGGCSRPSSRSVLRGETIRQLEKLIYLWSQLSLDFINWFLKLCLLRLGSYSLRLVSTCICFCFLLWVIYSNFTFSISFSLRFRIRWSTTLTVFLTSSLTTLLQASSKRSLLPGMGLMPSLQFCQFLDLLLRSRNTHIGSIISETC